MRTNEIGHGTHALKKVLLGLLSLVVLTVAGVLIVPNFIDWNDYKGDIQRLVKSQTGRELVIDGDIRIAVLPAPALVAQRVRFANVPGTVAIDMVQLASVEVRIAPGPLLSGVIQVESVRLIDPVIEIEILPDGSNNLSLDLAEDPAATASSSGEMASSGGFVPDVSLDSFVVRNGTVIYRDHRKGTVERIEELNATIAAASLQGPFETAGNLLIRGFPVTFDVTVGAVIQERTVPVSVALESDLAGLRVEANGALLGLQEMPKFKGRVAVSGDSLAATLHGLGGSPAAHGSLNQVFALEGELVADSQQLEFTSGDILFAEARGTVVASASPGDALSLSAAISITRVDLDKWLSLPPFDAAAPAQANSDTAGQDKNGKASVPLAPPPRSTAGAGDAAFTIPTNIFGVFDVNIDALNYRGSLVRHVQVSADIGNGVVTFNDAAAQLPGSSDVAAKGTLTAANGLPLFQGALSGTINDMRRVLDWQGIQVPPVPSDRLRKVTFKSAISATPDQIQLADLDIQVDSSRITGGVTTALRDRLAFGASLTLDRLNLDSYLPPEDSAGAGGAGRGGSSGAVEAGAGLQALSAFDANLKLAVKSMVYRRAPVTGLDVDLTLVGGQLELHRVSVANMVGTAIAVEGKVATGSGLPEVSGLRFTVDSKSPERLFRLLSVEPPVPLADVGAISLAGRMDGPVLQPKFDLTFKGAGAEATVKGTASLGLVQTAMDLDVGLRHPDAVRLLRVLGVAYRPAGRLGALDLRGHVKGTPGRLAATNVSVTLGKTAVTGTVDVDLSGPRPRMNASLATGDLIVDPFLPAARSARRITPPTEGRLMPAAWPVPRLPALPALTIPVARGDSARWSPEPVDLSALGTLDGTVGLQTRSLTYGPYRVDGAQVEAALEGGVLDVRRLSGRLFGGALTGSLTVNAAAPGRIDTNLALQGADLRAALLAINGKDMASGALDASLKGTTHGNSVANWVSALGGTGAFALRGVDVKEGARGTALAGVLDLLLGLNKVGAGLTGGSGSDKATVTGSFVMDRGIARTQDLRLVSGLGNGQAAGTINLPVWVLDIRGQLDLNQNLLARYLTRNTSKVPTKLPFQVTGPLDAPNVKLETAALGGQGLPIPGLNKLIEKQPGVGSVLQQLLPGVLGTPAPPQPQQQAPQPQQEPQKPPKPEDLLRGLLKGLR